MGFNPVINDMRAAFAAHRHIEGQKRGGWIVAKASNANLQIVTVKGAPHIPVFGEAGL